MMSDEEIVKIVNIWKDIYTITERDKTYLRKPARKKFNGITYGIYCGPYTDPLYSSGYENNKPYGDPEDCLDFLCYLHDKFFSNPIVDELMLQSIDILNDGVMIGSSVNINGTRNLLKIMRKGFNLWRHIT